MTTTQKWIAGAAVVAVLFVILIFYSSEIYIWLMSKLTTLIIWLVIFTAGWLLGRFGGRRSTAQE